MHYNDKHARGQLAVTIKTPSVGPAGRILQPLPAKTRNSDAKQAMVDHGYQ